MLTKAYRGLVAWIELSCLIQLICTSIFLRFSLSNIDQILISFMYQFLQSEHYQLFLFPPLQGTRFGHGLPLSITNLFSYYSTYTLYDNKDVTKASA